MFATADSGTAVAERPAATKPRVPEKYNVVLHDDDDHTFAYVMDMLREVFEYDAAVAYKLTEEVIEEGKAIVYTAANKVEAEIKRDKMFSFGRDKRMKDCKGSMTVTIEAM